MKILIADDERLARRRLISMIAKLYPDYDVGEAENGHQALDYINQYDTI